MFFACANVLGVYIVVIAEDRSQGNFGDLEYVVVFAFAGLFYALVASQIVCHSSWSVLCNWAGVWRPIFSGLAACLLYYCLLMSIWTMESSYRVRLPEVFITALALPAIMVTSQAPLWILRAGFRWQISGRVDREGRSQNKPLSVAGLLTATTVVAVALGCLRVGVALDVLDLEFLGVFAVVLPLLTLLAGIPTLFLVLWIRRSFVGWLFSIIMVALVLAGIGVMASIVATFVFEAPPDSDTVMTFGGFVAGFVVGWACFLSTPLLVARSIGARLHRGSNKHSTEEENRLKAHTTEVP